jgi:hypothetical protein
MRRVGELGRHGGLLHRSAAATRDASYELKPMGFLGGLAGGGR